MTVAATVRLAKRCLGPGSGRWFRPLNAKANRRDRRSVATIAPSVLGGKQRRSAQYQYNAAVWIRSDGCDMAGPVLRLTAWGPDNGCLRRPYRKAVSEPAGRNGGTKLSWRSTLSLLRPGGIPQPVFRSRRQDDRMLQAYATIVEGFGVHIRRPLSCMTRAKGYV